MKYHTVICETNRPKLANMYARKMKKCIDIRRSLVKKSPLAPMLCTSLLNFRIEDQYIDMHAKQEKFVRNEKDKV